MATTAIHDGAFAGALAGLMTGRPNIATTTATYNTLILQAKAIADAFVTFNNGSGAPIADADKVSMATIVYAAAMGAVDGRQPVSTSALDPASVAIGGEIYAVAVNAKTNGGLT